MWKRIKDGLLGAALVIIVTFPFIGFGIGYWWSKIEEWLK